MDTGDPKDPSKPFQFDCVMLNLPGQPTYCPSNPWVFKFRTPEGTIENNFFDYVDNVRTTGCSSEECWQCTRRVASSYNLLGLQDAARKRWGTSQTPGPWAGPTVSTTNQEILWIHQHLESESLLCRSTLESYRGTLVYISRTYPSITPYLKGIHLTIDSWYPHRDNEGWKLPATERIMPMAAAHPHPPTHVKAVPRLASNGAALLTLFQPDSPTLHPARPWATAQVFYGFGDASGSGFGTTLQLYDSLHYHHGQWCTAMSEVSSNYHELSNLVHGIKEAVHSNALRHCKLFIFTDNSVAEAAYHKGTSSSHHLFEQVLHLRTVEMHHQLFLHVIHIAGTRMQDQGTDGLSWGLLDVGVLQGSGMLTYIPLHLSALD